jgi:DNA-binding NarL/FixJ family response regulator
MSKTRVLLADDHALVRAGIRKALEALPDLEIVGEIGDGVALAVALEQTQPDCLLIDVAMPDFEPVPAIRQIRANNPDLKILVVSAYDDDVYVQGLLSAGVDGYHLKDQSLSDLQLAVQRVLEGSRWISGPLVDKLVSYASILPPSASPSFTTRQRDLLHLLQQGFDNQTIAQQLGLSVKTIENNLTRLYRLLNVQSRLEAVNYVMKHPRVLAVSGQIAAKEQASSEVSAQGLITVLLVDDNARYRRQLRRMIGKIRPKATIYEAENTQEATHLTASVMPELVLVDVILGEEDGIRCTRRIKALSPKSRVILISAYPDREFHRLGLEAGAVAFLDKKDLETLTLQHIIDDITA